MTPTITALTRAFRHGIVTAADPARPHAEYVQIAILHGQKLVQKFWSRSCPPEFVYIKHTASVRRLSLVGVGEYFEPVATPDALVICVLPLVEAIGHPDLTIPPDAHPLNSLAWWARTHSAPGSAKVWRCRNLRFRVECR